MKSQTVEIFPTVLMRFDASEIINDKDVQDMIDDIDDIHENLNELMQIDDLTIPYQSLPVLFNDRFPFHSRPHWKKLSDTFIKACYDYNHSVTEFVQNQESLALTGIRAWFYKSNRESWKQRTGRTYHNHRPSYLSGIFYLQVPGNLQQGGTEFCDPRGPGLRKNRNVELMPINKTWVIFPGSLDHAATPSDTDQWRYTVAADSYVRVM